MVRFSTLFSAIAAAAALQTSFARVPYVDEHNEIRKKNSVDPLKVYPTLVRAAEKRVKGCLNDKFPSDYPENAIVGYQMYERGAMDEWIIGKESFARMVLPRFTGIGCASNMVCPWGTVHVCLYA